MIVGCGRAGGPGGEVSVFTELVVYHSLCD